MSAESRVVRALADSGLKVTHATAVETWGPTVVVRVHLEGINAIWFIKATARYDVADEVRVLRSLDGLLRCPAVVAEGRASDLPGGKWFAMTALAGRPLVEGGLSPTKVDQALHNVGVSLRNVHRSSSCSTSTKVLKDRWLSWLSEEARQCLSSLTLMGWQVPENVQSAFDSVLHEVARQSVSEWQLSTIHGDLGDSEIIVSQDGAIGLVDWGDSRTGDPGYDFERMFAGGPVGDTRRRRYLPQVLSGYGEVRLAPNRIFLYRAHNALRNAHWASQEEQSWVPELINEVSMSLDCARGLGKTPLNQRDYIATLV